MALKSKALQAVARQKAEAAAARKKKKRAVRRVARQLGKKSDYIPEFAELGYQFALLGLTDREIAKWFGIAEATLNNWKIAHPEFAERLNDGKLVADARVAASLYQRATGTARVRAVKIMQYEGAPVIVPYDEVALPDVQAGIHWLKNRQHGRWRDRTETKIGGIEGEPIETVNLTPAEAYARMVAGKK